MGTIFTSQDIRGHADELLTTEYVWNVGKGLADWLPVDGDIVVVRSSDANPETVRALTEGLLLQGRNVVDAGQGDLHAVVVAISEAKAAGGALVAHDVGDNNEIITLFDTRGVVITDTMGLAEIAELVESGNFIPAAEKGTVKPVK